MRRFLIAAISLFVISACTNRYEYSITRYDALLNERNVEKRIITAKDDSTAFEKALQEFYASRDVYFGILKDGVTLPYPEKFELRNQAGDIVYFESLEREYERINQSLDSPSGKKAYAGTEFGMSKKDVKAAERFKEKEWSDFGDKLYVSDRVGNVNCSIVFGFVNDELYSVQFSELSGDWRDYDIAQSVATNFLDIFKEAYGTPVVELGIPRKSGISYGQQIPVAKWASPEKSMVIYFWKHRDRELYKSWAEIKNTNMADMKVKADEEKKQAEDEARRAGAIKDADLF